MNIVFATDKVESLMDSCGAMLTYVGDGPAKTERNAPTIHAMTAYFAPIPKDATPPFANIHTVLPLRATGFSGSA